MSAGHIRFDQVWKKFSRGERHDSLRRDMVDLMAEQRRTNRLLQGLVYGGIGFALGLIVMQVLVRVRLF